MLGRGAVVVAVLASLAAGGTAYAAPDGTADLTVAAAADGPAIPGQPLTWTVTVTNQGPSVAENVTLNQTVPVAGGEAIISAVSAVGPCTVTPPGTVTCSLGELDAEAAVPVTVAQTLSADRTDAPSTTARVTAATTDGGTGDNSASATADRKPAADLWLTGSVTGPDPVLGGPPTVSLLLTDNGPGDVPAGARATLTLPDPVNFAADGSSSGCSASGRKVTCVVNKSIGVGSKNAVSLTVRGTDAPAGSLPYPASVQVPAGVTDPEPADDKLTLTNPGGTDAAVIVTAAGPADPVAAGTTASVTYTVTNHGPADATGVTLAATLPTGLALDSSANGCTATGQTVSCPTIPTLAAGASAAMVLSLAVDPGQPAGTVLVPAQLTVGAPANHDPGTPTGYLVLNVVHQANLALNASRADAPLTAGDPVSFQLTVHNFGPGTATGVTVTDRLPAEVALGTAAVPGGTCASAGRLHTCTLGAPLAADASATVTVTGTVSASVAGDTLTDTGFASATDPDLDVSDNGASSAGVVEGALTPAAHQVAAQNPVRRVVARLTWWIWAGAATVLLGMTLLAIALRRDATVRADR